MGDVGDHFRDLKDHYKEKERRWKAGNMARANPAGWTQHSEWHWSRVVAGKKIDYWPSTDKFMVDGVVRQGGVKKFIKKLEAKGNTK